MKIATHAEFKDWIEGHGIEFGRVEGDPAELMRICVENGMFTYSFLKEATSKVRQIYCIRTLSDNNHVQSLSNVQELTCQTHLFLYSYIFIVSWMDR